MSSTTRFDVELWTHVSRFNIENESHILVVDRRLPSGRKIVPLSRSPVLCSQARNAPARREREVIFDTDSARVGVDNRCSGCISHVATDFVGELVESDVAIKGFAGSITRKVMKGTLRWKWTDDDGRTHKFLIPDSFYVPHGGARLLSPQHWDKLRRIGSQPLGQENGPTPKNVSFTGTKNGTKRPSTWIRVDRTSLPCDSHPDTTPSKPSVLRQR